MVVIVNKKEYILAEVNTAIVIGVKDEKAKARCVDKAVTCPLNPHLSVGLVPYSLSTPIKQIYFAVNHIVAFDFYLAITIGHTLFQYIYDLIQFNTFIDICHVFLY